MVFSCQRSATLARSANLHVASKRPSCIRMHDSPYQNAQHGGCPIWRPRVALVKRKERWSVVELAYCRTVANVDGEGTAQPHSRIDCNIDKRRRRRRRDTEPDVALSLVVRCVGFVRPAQSSCDRRACCEKSLKKVHVKTFRNIRYVWTRRT